MKYAADFKQIARDCLRGNWRVAILTGFVASLIGANFFANGTASGSNSSDLSDIKQNYPEISDFLKDIAPFVFVAIAVLAIFTILSIVIGGAGKLGYAKFNLNLIDRNYAKFSDLFSYFNQLGTGFVMNFLVGLYTFLWTLLFIIPGIIKAYSYSMTPYILAENPEKSVDEAISLSKYIMEGNKWRLFCLEFSFIGWELLGTVPSLVLSPLALTGALGIAIWMIISLSSIFILNLCLTPYKAAAHAAFYREVSSTFFTPYIPEV